MVTTHGYGALGDRALPREYIILHCFQGRAGSPSTPLQRRFAIIRIAAATGSTKPLESAMMHSGTGRISQVQMRTMSLFESGESKGQVSLASLFSGEEPEGISDMEIDHLAFVTARGGWPAAVDASGSTGLQQAVNYLDAIVETDVSEVDGMTRNPARVRALMRSIARNIAGPASVATLCSDIAGDNVFR